MLLLAEQVTRHRPVPVQHEQRQAVAGPLPQLCCLLRLLLQCWQQRLEGPPLQQPAADAETAALAAATAAAAVAAALAVAAAASVTAPHQLQAAVAAAVAAAICSAVELLLLALRQPQTPHCRQTWSRAAALMVGVAAAPCSALQAPLQQPAPVQTR
jgi:hypothetical protein